MKNLFIFVVVVIVLMFVFVGNMLDNKDMRVMYS